MSILHTLNSPHLLELCLRSVNAGDSILLIENGVYLARQQSSPELPADVQVHALESDVDARGLTERISSGVKTADYSDFVRLCCDHDKVINWF